MNPETPPPADRGEQEPPRREPPFGPEAQASVERSLAALKDPDDALRVLSLVNEHGAAFAAYLLLPDTNVAAKDIEAPQVLCRSYAGCGSRLRAA